LISTRGYSSTEVEDVYSRARQLCERFGDVPLPVLYGVWAVHLVRCDVRGVNRLAPLLARIVETSGDADQLLIARSCLAVRAFYRVNLAEARTHLRAASDLVDPSGAGAQHDRMLASYAFDAILSGPVWLAWVAAIEGDEDEARAELRKAVRLSEQIGDPYIVCQVAAYLATLSRELRDVETARGLAERALALSHEHGLQFWQALALCAQSWVRLQEGSPEEAVALARTGLAIFEAIGSVINRPYFSTYLLEAQLRVGDCEAALRTADESLLVCRESLGPMYEPEILRLKGLVLLESGSEEGAMDCLQAALAQSRLQGAKLFEVRAATSLGRLLERRKMLVQAREVLEASCAKWSASSLARDLEEARSVLAALPNA
jgi:tetratricopeptide (TPR) repeat protein